jgi:hypothetical protein
MTTLYPGQSRRKVHIKFFTPYYCNKSGRFKSGLTNQFLPNASIPESIWTRSSGLPLSNSQPSNANHNVVDCRRSQQSFDQARSKCHCDGALTTDPIFYGPSTATQIFANPGPEADHPPASVPATTNEESDEDAPAELFNSEEEDQFASSIFGTKCLTCSTASTSGGLEAHLHFEEKFEENSHWCGICDVWKRDDQIEEHLRSMKHKKNEKRIPQPNRDPESPVSSSVQWRGPVSVFAAVAVLLIACLLVTPVAVSIHVDREFLLERPQAQARLAERPTKKSKLSVLEIPAGGSSTIEIPRA